MFPLTRVEAQFDPAPWEWAQQNRARIDENWQRRLDEKPAMFNGLVMVCTRHAIADGVLTVTLREANYASYMAMQDFGASEEAGAINCFGLAALRSRDGALIMGEMAAHTANGGRVYFPGGSLDHSDRRQDNSIDVAGSVARELWEETGLGAEEVDFAPGWMAVVGPHGIALLKGAYSPLSAQELKTRIDTFLASETKPELAGVRIVRTLRDIDVASMPGFVQHYAQGVLTS